MHFPHFRPASGLLAALILLSAGCAGTAPLQSAFRSSSVLVDGDENDWYEYLRPVEKQNMSIGIVNDDDFLYVGMMTSDPVLLHQMATRGIVLWVDPAGGRAQSLGLQFPLGLAEAAGNAPLPRTESAFEELFERSLLEMELVRDAGAERVRLPTNTIPGVATGASLENGTLFYEIRLPLAESGPYTFAAGATPGGTIGIGIESAEVDPEDRRRQMLEGAANSPMQGGGTYGSPYGGYNNPTPNRRTADDAVRVWRRVVLAE